MLPIRMRISIMMLRVLIGPIEHAGVSRAVFLREVGVDSAALEDGSGWMSLERYGRVLERARAVSGDPALGLHMGEHTRAVMLDVVGPLLEHSGTLREAFDAMGPYSRLLSVGHEPELHERGDSAWIRFPSLRGDGPFVQVTAEWVMASLVPFLRLFVGAQGLPRRVAFAYPAPAHAAEYRRLFRGAECFDRKFTQLELPRAWLDEAQPYRSPQVYDSLKAQADRALGRIDRTESTRDRVVRALSKGETVTVTTVAEVARELDTSERSLHRRLRAEGLSFSALLAEHRMAEAKRRLEGPNASIQQVAFALGFKTAASFHRAFKRWTGMTPRQYQESL